MAQGAPLANTLVTRGVGTGHEKEDLADVIRRIDPAQAPFYENANKSRARARSHDWTVQELQTVDTTAQPEGFEATMDALKVPDRFGNEVQITARTGSVSDTYNNVDIAGNQRETARQRIVQALSVRRDLEAIVTQNLAKVPGNTRVMAGAPAWITNVSVGATGSAPTGDGTDPATPGTDRAFDTIDYIDNVNEMSYNEGGNVRAMFMRPDLKRKFSKLPDAMGGATENRVNQTERQPLTFVGSVDKYLSDFSTMDVVVSRFMIEKTILGMDPSYYSICHLPNANMVTTPLAKTGHADKFMVTNECTLEMSAPKAHWAVHALDSSL